MPIAEAADWTSILPPAIAIGAGLLSWARRTLGGTSNEPT